MMRSIIAAALVVPLSTLAFAAAPQAEQGEKATDTRTKVICKRFLETGSLVRGYRICKIKIDWERDRDQLRQSSATTSCRSLGEGGSCS